MLTALDSTDDKIRGFDAGADDYLTKPFEFRGLIARLRALAHRGKAVQRGRMLELADLTVNLDAQAAKRGETKIELSTKEFALLEFLLHNKDKIASRAQISSSVWNMPFDTETNVIDVYINFLRRKIDKNFSPKLIHTIIGRGYMMSAKKNEEKKEAAT